VQLYRTFWERNKDRSLGEWVLDALAARKHPTTLSAEALRHGIGTVAVPELARILETAQDWYLRAQAGALLRETTAKDFGAVSRASSLSRCAAIAERYRGLLTLTSDSDRK
jgi:hypothetical protein